MEIFCEIFSLWDFKSENIEERGIERESSEPREWLENNHVDSENTESCCVWEFQPTLVKRSNSENRMKEDIDLVWCDPVTHSCIFGEFRVLKEVRLCL